MLHKLRNRAKDEQGFTLIELLVVILIIGILAAIALPTFLGQRSKAQDSSAQSNARNLVSHLESCYATERTYAAPCNTAAGLNDGEPLGFPWGTGNGQASVTAGTADSYTVQATSDNGHTFSIVKASGTGAVTYPCTTAGDGGCPSDGSWN